MVGKGLKINMSPCLWVTDVLFTQNVKSKWVLGVMYLGIKECILGAFGSVFMHRYLPKEKFKYNRERNTGSECQASEGFSKTSCKPHKKLSNKDLLNQNCYGWSTGLYFVKHPGDLIGPGSALGNQTLN